MNISLKNNHIVFRPLSIGMGDGRISFDFLQFTSYKGGSSLFGFHYQRGGLLVSVLFHNITTWEGK